MEMFYHISTEMTYLFVLMAIGFVSGKWLKVDSKSISTLSVSVFSPIVFFLTVANMDFTSSAIVAPAAVVFLCLILGITVLHVSRLYLGERTPYLAALSAGTSNWGYFGIPVALSIFDADMAGIYVLLGFGTNLYENSFGVYFISRGRSSPLDSIKNVAKFPATYAIALGLAVSYFGVDMPSGMSVFYGYMKGAYVVAGMMMIGLGIADMRRMTVDAPFVATVFAAKFVLSPIVFSAFVWADAEFFGILSADYYPPLLLLSLMPMAANNIAYAMRFEMRPEKAAVACLATTVAALLYIPFMVGFLHIAD